jgi:homoserine kinase
MNKVTVKVPATSANLGSAFDCAGIAFELYNVLSFEKQENGVSFDGFDPIYANENNLAYISYQKTCETIGVPASVKLRWNPWIFPFPEDLAHPPRSSSQA